MVLKATIKYLICIWWFTNTVTTIYPFTNTVANKQYYPFSLSIHQVMHISKQLKHIQNQKLLSNAKTNKTNSTNLYISNIISINIRFYKFIIYIMSKYCSINTIWFILQYIIIIFNVQKYIIHYLNTININENKNNFCNSLKVLRGLPQKMTPNFIEVRTNSNTNALKNKDAKTVYYTQRTKNIYI